MEVAKVEVAAVEKIIADLAAAEIAELHDLQLALVGGGIGEVIVA